MKTQMTILDYLGFDEAEQLRIAWRIERAKKRLKNGYKTSKI